MGAPPSELLMLACTEDLFLGQRIVAYAAPGEQPAEIPYWT